MREANNGAYLKSVHCQSNWLRIVHHGHDNGPTVICFPHAGGGVSALHRWFREYDGEVSVIGVQLPAREDRLDENAIHTFDAIKASLITEIACLVEGGAYLFGHSLGALIAFRFALALENDIGLVPKHLFLSARRGPLQMSMAADMCDLDDEKFVGKLIQLNGIPESVVKSPEMLRILLLSLRGDFLLSRSLEQEMQQLAGDLKITSPITTFVGMHDSGVCRSSTMKWKGHTISRFSQHIFDGDHFFPNIHGKTILSIINQYYIRDQKQIRA